MTDIVTLKTYATNSRLTHAKPAKSYAQQLATQKRTPNWRRHESRALRGSGRECREDEACQRRAGLPHVPDQRDLFSL